MGMHTINEEENLQEKISELEDMHLQTEKKCKECLENQ